ncbi:MAG: MalY/PatB family protein [Clostridiaceae bacterium]
MKYDFDEIIDRTNTHSLKYEGGRAGNPFLPEQYIPLWVADMDFACAPQILDAMKRRIDRRIFGYSVLGKDNQRSVSRWMERRFHWQVAPEEIIFASGVVSALFAAVEHLTSPGDGVLLMTPAYHPFNDAIHRFRRKPLYSRLLEQSDGRYEIDFADFEEKAKRADCSLFFLCNPQNPTGRVFTREELLRIGEICFANGVFVLSDEIHADLTRTGQTHLPFASLFPGEKRIITCTSPSKTFNLAGNNHSHLMIPDERLRREWSSGMYCGMPTAVGIDAAIAAYDEAEDWLDELKAYLDENFRKMSELLHEKLPKAKFRIPEGTYLAWVDLTAYCLPEQKLKEVISRAGVFVQFGEDFVDHGDCHMRVNAACPWSKLKEGLERVCKALN